MRDSPPPPPLLADVMPAGGMSWSRLVTGLVLLALSLVIASRGARHQPPAKAVPQPVPQRLVAGTPLPPLEPAVVFAPPPSDAAPSAAPDAAITRAMRVDAPRLETRHRLRHAAAVPETRRVVLAHRDRSTLKARSGATARRTFTLTRAQVRREYLRERDVVAALTGEDSGSAYLARAAARAHAPRFEAGRHRGVRGNSARG